MSHFDPADPELAARVPASFARQAMMRTLGAPGKGEGFLARGRVLRAGRTLTTCVGDLFAIAGGEEKHVLTMLATMMTVQGRPSLADEPT